MKFLKKCFRDGNIELETILNIKPCLAIQIVPHFPDYSSMNSVVGIPSTEATVTQTIVGFSPVFST